MLTREKETFMDDTIYDHYIAIDWALENMAIARMTKKSNKITAIDVPSDIADLRAYLKNLKGTKILTIEETTPTQWLYTELQDHVDRIFICDPTRNKLLNEGPKNDGCNTKKLHRLSCQRQVRNCVVIKHISNYPKSFSTSIFQLTCQD